MKLIEKKKDKINVQYAFRYGLTILVTAFFVFLLANWVLNKYREELVQNTREDINEVALKLDKDITRQKEMAMNIYYNKLTKPSYMLFNNIQTVDGIEQLGVFHDNLLINDYLFVKYQDEILFTQNGSVAVNTFTDKILHLDADAKERLRVCFREQKPVMEVLKTKSGSKLLLYLYPVPSEYNCRGDVVGFIIKEETLKKYFRESVGDIPGYMIATADNEILFEFCQIGGDLSDNNKEQIREKLLSSKEIKKGKILIDVYRAENGFSLCTAIDTRKVLAEFHKIVFNFFGIGIIIFILAFIVVSFINRQNVRQIKKIKDSLLELNEQSIVGEQNDFVLIQKLIDQACVEQQMKETKRKQFYSEMSGLIAKFLFDGLIEDEKVLTNITAQFCPQLKGAYYGVMSIVFRNEVPLMMEEFAESEELSVFSLESWKDYHIISFVVSLKQGEREERRRLSEQLLSEAAKHHISDVLVVNGGTYEKLREIHRSYNEMLSLTSLVVERNQANGFGIFFFEDVVKECLDGCISDERIRELKKGIRTGTMEETTASLKDIVSSIDGIQNQVQRSFAFYTLIQLLYELLQEKDCAPGRLERLVHLTYEDADALCETILKIIKTVKEDDQISVERIMDYISQNYKEHTFGLEALAAHFHLSTSYISRYIKNNSGKNYSEYITQLRIQEACRLLEETDMNIQDITFAVGYSDNVSFSKKFKSLMGVTMGEYRKQSNKNNEKEQDGEQDVVS